jgi:VIT1/CCC1 family predicted Fe2+/Mn2+ transporter
MNTEKMSKWALLSICIALVLVAGMFIGQAVGDSDSTPISEMTVEQLFVLVIIAALLIGR